MDKEKIKIVIKSIGLAVITVVLTILAFLLAIGSILGIVYAAIEHKKVFIMIVGILLFIGFISFLAYVFYHDFIGDKENKDKKIKKTILKCRSNHER